MDSPSQPDAFSFDIKIKVHLFEDFASSAAWVMGNMFDDDNDGAVAKKTRMFCLQEWKILMKLLNRLTNRRKLKIKIF